MSKPRVVLVTGGSRGLGAALVRHFLAAGDTVASFGRSEAPKLDADTSRLVWESLDARDADAVTGFVRRLQRAHGGIDALVNNAGIAPEGAFTTQRRAEIQSVLGLNLEATLGVTQAVTKAMLVNQRGSIVSISSIHAHHGHAGVAAYAATKAGLEGMTRALARELGPAGIRVNCVAPGFFASEMTAGMPPEVQTRLTRRTPLGRLGTVDDVVPVVGFLLSDAARFVTGQTVIVDGGYTS